MNDPLRPYDLIAIGAGPAGISAAAAAGLMGFRVALVEQRATIGGAGINTGTVPSKTLRETAVVLSGARSRQLYGVDLSLRRQIRVPDLMHHEEQVVAGEHRRWAHLLRKRGVEVLHGTARFVDPHTVAVVGNDGKETTLRGTKVLIATGSSPIHPPGFVFEDPRVHDSNEILELQEMPARLAVIGAGIVGSEYACIFAALGVEVRVIDGRDSLLGFLDGDVSKALLAAMQAMSIHFHWKTRVTRCDTSQPGDAILTLDSGETLPCDGVLVCGGRSSNTDGLNLAAAGLTPGERGLIKVNGRYRTDVPHIYAAGDVIGPPALAATSIEQARVAVADAFEMGLDGDMEPILPTGIYTIPEASFVGATEEAVQASGVEYVTGKARYEDLPRGQIIGDRGGFLKMIFRKSDLKLLGVHVFGELATELVHIGQLAMVASADATLFTRVCFNYPTLGDLYKNAAYDALLKAGRLGRDART